METSLLNAISIAAKSNDEEMFKKILALNFDFSKIQEDSLRYFWTDLIQLENEKYFEYCVTKLPLEKFLNNIFCYVKTPEKLEYLKEKGFEPLGTFNILEHNCIKGNLNMVKYVVDEYKEDEESLKEGFIKACRNGKYDVMEYLFLNFKINVNCRDKVNGSTPLMFAAQSNRYNIVKFLLKNGADKTLKSEKLVKTALEFFNERLGYSKDMRIEELLLGEKKEIIKMITTPHNDKVLFYSDGVDLTASIIGTSQIIDLSS